jgi:hypothetical protein
VKERMRALSSRWEEAGRMWCFIFFFVWAGFGGCCFEVELGLDSGFRVEIGLGNAGFSFSC